MDFRALKEAWALSQGFFAEWTLAWTAATRDLCIAVMSTARLMWWTFQPLCWTLYYLGQRLVESLDLNDIYKALKCITLWIGEKALASPQTAAVSVTVSLVGVWAWGKRRAAWLWWDDKQRRARQRYRRLLHRCGQTQKWLAIMLPHSFFAMIAVVGTLIFPQWVRYLAMGHLRNVLSIIGPAFFTFGIVVLEHITDNNNERNSNIEKENTPRRNGTPKTPKRRSARKLSNRTAASPNAKSAKEQSEKYWFQYWTIYASYQLMIQGLYSLPLSSLWLRPSLWAVGRQVELLLLLWLHLMPFLVVEPNYQPVSWIYRLIQPTLARLGTLVNLLRAPWNAHVVPTATKIVQGLEWVGVLKRTTGILEALQQGPALVLPLSTLIMPLLMPLGVVLSKFYLPLVLERSPDQSLQFWVLFCLAEMAWTLIGFRPALICLVFWIWFSLYVPENFAWLVRECRYWGLLDGNEEESSAIRAWEWVLKYIPKHDDLIENEDQSAAGQEVPAAPPQDFVYSDSLPRRSPRLQNS